MARAAQRTSSWKLRRVAGTRILMAAPLARLPWLVHGFGTRIGGASVSSRRAPRDAAKGAGHGLNLGFTDGDSRQRVLRNRAAFIRGLGAEDMPLAALRQIHSDAIHRVSAPPAEPLRGDALLTGAPEILLGVQTADCVPILLVDIEHRCAAAVHAGWRGTLQRIAAKTAGRMQMEFGSRPERLLAALGPAIGACCYEVGGEVVRGFAAQFPNAREWFDGPFDALAGAEPSIDLEWLSGAPPGHPPPEVRARLDLLAANRALLEQAGLARKNIFCAGLCTACRSDLFFSYRREGSAAGRMLAAIGMRAGREPR
jgi:purine-nucleoside/S-methyl-5'-thioadenosine phosphorylase / adenosine deaminase